jgi:hypothetical protein
MIRAESVLGVIGGLAAGYVLWLLAFSIAGDNATAGQWAPVVLAASGVLAVCALVSGVVQRRRGKPLWSAVAFGLPVFPVVLTLAVLADVRF